jgi:hypothetical protein
VGAAIPVRRQYALDAPSNVKTDDVAVNFAIVELLVWKSKFAAFKTADDILQLVFQLYKEKKYKASFTLFAGVPPEFMHACRQFGSLYLC